MRPPPFSRVLAAVATAAYGGIDREQIEFLSAADAFDAQLHAANVEHIAFNPWGCQSGPAQVRRACYLASTTEVCGMMALPTPSEGLAHCLRSTRLLLGGCSMRLPRRGL